MSEDLDTRRPTGSKRSGADGSPGTEPTAAVRLPGQEIDAKSEAQSGAAAFRKRRRRLRLRRALPWAIGLLVVALVATGVWLVGFSSAFAVEKVSVTGTSTLSVKRIERVAAVPVGRPLARVDLAAIEHRVETIPAVRSAHVTRVWPHTVRVAVTQRVPVAVVERGSGLTALDDTGHTFAGYSRRPARLPLVKPAGAVTRAALAEGGRVAGSLATSLRARVDYVAVDSVDQISLHLKDGRIVVWGGAGQSAQKAQVAAVLLRKPVQQVDVSVPEHPTTLGTRTPSP